ncbi:MAG: KamA family radical SAM protein [Alphaproteobacteria bacterium]|nr:KamA family radical SAM protein [Alphaproteobacteria bacterium]MDE1986623.1 KamA family radical SAM protein [Alphaproteobacteria bacterium]MDE2164435.1 KamA family radical SAM protein [Alphaproteobacteria bacterium]MDE2264571.1 KamA family radical SAM protein [Alphaproteobacteria bacterium]MDE2499102.1 KamA family radical SAM protein [Alphaproteobacteria bacterium]
MSLQVVRGRELKPPLRPVRPRPALASDTPLQEATKVSSIASAKSKAAPRFPVNPETRAFYRRFYPGTSSADWNDWRWQLRTRIRTLDELARIFALSADERAAVEHHEGSLPVGITPYYASLMGLDDPSEPLRRTHIMTGAEYIKSPGEDDDPLGEDHDTVVPGLVHRYPDRVLFLTTGTCSTYCRYCTRARVVGNPGGEYQFSTKQWEKALAYLEVHTEVRDVLLSGGDPLTIGDDKLDWLLGRLRAMKHIEFLRIGTKIPVVLPQRITKDFVKMLKKYHPLWMSIHVTHPVELTDEVTESTARLADAGIPLGSQTVLLKDINDSPSVMVPLMQGLLKRRVKPYYLYQCDPIRGSAHFRTNVEKGLEIISALRGHTTGYATPMFCIDAPGGGGKIQLAPDPVVGRDGDDLLLRNFEGKVYRYPDPGGTVGRDKPRLAAE